MITVQSDNIGATVWQDTKAVTVMYSGFDPSETTTVLRKVRVSGSRQYQRCSVPCPVAMAAYNKYMGGVDRGDQLRGYHQYQIRSRKYYKYIANFLVWVSLTNSYILCRLSHPGASANIKTFQETLANQLIQEYCTRRRAGRVPYQIVPLPLRHFPTKATSNTGRKRGRCSLCQEKRKRTDTQWVCRECGVWLCHPGTADDCFLLWHRRILQ